MTTSSSSRAIPASPRLRVLLVEGDLHAAGGVEATLRAAGHVVERCVEPGQLPFPCRALSEGACPLDAESVDVALLVRLRVRPRPTAFEAPVTCALRHGVPLVVAGRLALHPYERWAAASVEGDERVVAACEAAAEGRAR